MANVNNPLRQYFRRPAVYITLPSKGKFYPQGALETTETGELPVYPMTAIDEITSKTPDALFNGSAIAELIKSCVPAIKDPWSIPSTDLDTVLVAIRAATNGNNLDIESVCESCGETSKYGVNLMGMLGSIDISGYDKLLTIGELSFKFKPLTFKVVNQGNLDQFELQRQINILEGIEDQDERSKQSNALLKKLNTMNTSIVANTIESISTPTETVTDKAFIFEYLNGCDKNTFEEIRLHVVALRDASNIKPLQIT